MATAAWCEVAQAEEGQFRIVPRKRENWLKDVEGVCVFFWQCVLSTVQYCSRLDTFLQVQGQCHFLGHC